MLAIADIAENSAKWNRTALHEIEVEDHHAVAYSVGVELRLVASRGARFYDPLEDVDLDDLQKQSESGNKELTGFSCKEFRLLSRYSCITGVQYLMPAFVSRLEFHDIKGAKIGLRTFGTRVMNKP